MANYNTFNLVDTKTNRTILTTSSARKCKREIQKGYRIDVWNGNTKVEVIYNRNIEAINVYVRLEKEYIARKQKQAEERNKKRKQKLARKAELRNGNRSVEQIAVRKEIIPATV